MRIEVRIADQRLDLLDGDTRIRTYQVSTAAKGPGERAGSYCTPRGHHRIRAKVGAGLPLGAVLRGRRPTGEICDDATWRAAPDRDWILTRILWLCGEEPGVNRGGDIDTFRRYVYIHGTPDAVELGRPGSRGCVRMRNRDVVELFDLVGAGTKVLIRG
ncbi:MAG: L,D-transpeptidase [Rhodocyclaceae bacterium]|nr:L,D-transpeptidase [Rhodocyclaceae bacterium]